MPISRFLISTKVVEYLNAGHINGDFLRSLNLSDVEAVLFKTSNSQWQDKKKETFQTNFIALKPSAAQVLVDRGIRLVGIDYLSIEPFDCVNHHVHKILLNKNIIILEGINLSSVPPGEYLLVCLPLNINSPDGSPVRAVLVKGNLKEMF